MYLCMYVCTSVHVAYIYHTLKLGAHTDRSVGGEMCLLMSVCKWWAVYKYYALGINTHADETCVYDKMQHIHSI